MEKFNKIKSTIVNLPINNIDTDQIIPARFLKATDRIGFGENLFKDWRFDKNNIEVSDFPLNNQKGKILLAGNNFGCGSSREHAAWALYDYGFRAVVSTFFADIFKNNALNNGLLPIEISKENYNKITYFLKENNKPIFEVDLESQKFESSQFNFLTTFQINSYKKKCLLSGYDDIDFLLTKIEQIKQYEILNEK